MWPTKPGSATLPFFGVQPVLLTEKGEEIEGAAEGILAIKGAWPSMFRDLYNNHERYEETYFSPFKVMGCAGRRDAAPSPVPAAAWPSSAGWTQYASTCAAHERQATADGETRSCSLGWTWS